MSRPQISFFKGHPILRPFRTVLKGTKANTWFKNTITFIEIWGKTSKGHSRRSRWPPWNLRPDHVTFIITTTDRHSTCDLSPSRWSPSFINFIFSFSSSSFILATTAACFLCSCATRPSMASRVAELLDVSRLFRWWISRFRRCSVCFSSRWLTSSCSRRSRSSVSVVSQAWWCLSLS